MVDLPQTSPGIAILALAFWGTPTSTQIGETSTIDSVMMKVLQNDRHKKGANQ